MLNNGLLSVQGMSGSDQRAVNLAKLFASKNYSITMVIPESGRERYKGFNCLITSRSMPRGNISIVISYFLRAWKTAGMFYRYLKNQDRDAIIYSTSDLIPDTIPAIYAKIKIPSLRWITGLHLVAPSPFKGFQKASTKGYVFPKFANIYYFLTQRLIMRFMKKYAYLVMVSNSLDREFLIKKGFASQKVIVTYGAINWDELNLAASSGYKYDACFVGRFHKQKGFPDLIEAWKKVCLKYPRALLVVIGDDINFDSVVKKVNAEGLSNNIKFLGFLGGVEKFNIMKASKMCVFPSTYESFGMVIAEAFACSLPVVAYSLPIYEDIYPQGLLTANIGDVNGLVQQIISLLSDEQVRLKVSKEAYEVSKKFTWAQTAEQILMRLN